MDAHQLLTDFQARGICVIPEGGNLAVQPASRLSEADRIAIRQAKRELLRILKPEPERIAADSRKPIALDIREKIAAIESEARQLGWPAELLWNSQFWGQPRGLAAVLDEGDEIVEVAADYISILKVRRDLLRFRRHAA